MKAVILAGGLGTRLSEETLYKPKPMVEIGGMPIIWHILKLYSFFGINDFIICAGYKSYFIKEFFYNYFLHQPNIFFDIQNSKHTSLKKNNEKWKISIIDTGNDTMTGGRIKRIQDYIDDTFCLTYGDGLANIDLSKLILFHKNHSKIATVTAVNSPSRFGALELNGDNVTSFEEKPKINNHFINGGFFVLEPKIFDYIDGDSTIWEKEPLTRIAKDGSLNAFIHDDFWHPMDTLRDKIYLDDLYTNNKAPWKLWNE